MNLFSFSSSDRFSSCVASRSILFIKSSGKSDALGHFWGDDGRLVPNGLVHIWFLEGIIQVAYNFWEALFWHGHKSLVSGIIWIYGAAAIANGHIFHQVSLSLSRRSLLHVNRFNRHFLSWLIHQMVYFGVHLHFSIVMRWKFPS